MKLFVANTSLQDHQFIFRLPERTQTVAPLNISAGRQLMVIDTTAEIIDMIVEHHRIYGMKHYKEVDAKSFNGLLYSLDAPVPLDTFGEAQELNDTVLEKAGEEIRQVQAAAMNNKLEDTVGGDVSLSVQVIEENSPGIPTTLNETIKVDKKARK